MAPFDLADDLQRRDLVGDIDPAPLVDEGHFGIEVAGVARGQLDPSGVGGHHGERTLHLAEVLDEGGERGQRVERFGGEALDLSGVQVHRYQTIGAGGVEQVGHEPGGDRFPGHALLVLAGVPEPGHHGDDPVG